MNITFDEAIENHRKMWSWIADETEKRKRIVNKSDYFIENGIDLCYCMCFCCQYAFDNSKIMRNEKVERDCNICPIEWGGKILKCCDCNTKYDQWKDNALVSGNWKKSSQYAREIANLPAREETRR